jgi:D-methionine transport system ATP-binding protein
MIELTQVRKVFRQGSREIVALDGVDLQVPRGEVLGVIGASGAGKSTLIRCINLLERPTAGTVSVDGVELTTRTPRQLRSDRQKIGMIFQHFNLLSSRTVAGNVAFALQNSALDREARRRKVAELLERVGLADRARAYPAQLSGGQKQRVGIARALAADPTVLLCDEATSALDPGTTDSVLALLRELNHELGLTVVLITHEMSVVKAVCDSVALLEAGRIVEHGELREVVTRPGSRLAEGLLPKVPEHLPTQAGLVLDVVFDGDNVSEPILSSLARKLDLDVVILGGGIETLGNGAVGRLRIELPGEVEQQRAALDYLAGLGVDARRVA